MASSGLGWEDIVASLRRQGVACDEAAIRSYVLGERWKWRTVLTAAAISRRAESIAAL